MRTGLARLRDAGAAGCVLVGDPRYYGRFGFAQDPARSMEGGPPEVLLALPWIDRIDWAEHAVHFDVDRRTIRGGPEFDPEMPVNREFEERLYDYYGRPRYWV